LVAPIEALKLVPFGLASAAVTELEDETGTVKEVVLGNTFVKLTASSTVFSLTWAEFNDLETIAGKLASAVLTWVGVGPVKPNDELKLELPALIAGARTILFKLVESTAVAYKPIVGIELTIELAIFALVEVLSLKISLA